MKAMKQLNFAVSINTVLLTLRYINLSQAHLYHFWLCWWHQMYTHTNHFKEDALYCVSRVATFHFFQFFHFKT